MLLSVIVFRKLTLDYMKDPGNVHVARMQQLLADMEKVSPKIRHLLNISYWIREFHAAIIDSLDNAYFSELKNSRMVSMIIRNCS